jgi:LuxR family maltose regulon positive regulatory protein
MGNIWTLVTGLTDLAAVSRDQGKLRQARAVLEQALDEASLKGARNLGFIARTEEHLAYILYEQNELDSAQRLLSGALAHTRFWPNPNYLVLAYVCQARIRLAQRDLQGAWIAVDQANQIRRSTQLTRWLHRFVEVEAVQVWLAFLASETHLPANDPLGVQASGFVTTWRNELAGSAENDGAFLDEASEIAALSLARVSYAAGRTEEALTLLGRFTWRTQAAGHLEKAIASLVLTAMVLQACPPLRGKPDGMKQKIERPVSALAALEEALHLAEPGGYVRVFLNEGQPMQGLLEKWLSQASDGPLRDYATHLLTQFAGEPQGENATQEKVSEARSLVDPGVRPGMDRLVEPLSPREREVLDLIALGMTNQEIARQLVVSPGTVKAHTASIYRKLDVTNRTEAVARAREHGILP